MDALTQEQWEAIGPVLNTYAVRLDGIVENGTYVHDTAKGFLFHLMTDVGAALTRLEREREEDEAWNAHAARKNSAALLNDPNDWV